VYFTLFLRTKKKNFVATNQNCMFVLSICHPNERSERKVAYSCFTRELGKQLKFSSVFVIVFVLWEIF